MKQPVNLSVKVALLALTLLIWWWALTQPLSSAFNLSLIIGCVLLVIPLVWLARVTLDRRPEVNRAEWITTFVHYGVGILFGVAVIRAIITYPDWSIWPLHIPVEIGLLLVIFTGAAGIMAVVNLALKGFGAPFAISLSKRLAVDWMYAWTRNPMVLAALALLLSLGIWYQSIPFILWALCLVTPALLFFLKMYEERELEIRFGASYLKYKAKTPFLIPRKPAG